MKILCTLLKYCSEHNICRDINVGKRLTLGKVIKLKLL